MNSATIALVTRQCHRRFLLAISQHLPALRSGAEQILNDHGRQCAFSYLLIETDRNQMSLRPIAEKGDQSFKQTKASQMKRKVVESQCTLFCSCGVSHGLEELNDAQLVTLRRLLS